MPDPTPPRPNPTQRVSKPLSPGSSPGLKPVAKKTSSSTQIPQAGKPPTVRRAAPPPSKVEIVASSDDIEASEVRSRMAAGSARPQGLSLRLKIVGAMAGITVATAILIFVVVNSKAVGQLSDEIDAKGVRLCKTLSTIDAGYWKYAITHRGDEFKKQVDAFMQRIPVQNKPGHENGLFPLPRIDRELN